MRLLSYKSTINANIAVANERLQNLQPELDMFQDDISACSEIQPKAQRANDPQTP